MIAEKDIATCTAADQTRDLLRSQRPAEAVRLMRGTLMERLGTAEEYSLLGMALAQSGESAAALHALDQAVGVDPSDAVAHFHRGQLYLQEGRRREALEAFEHALAMRPRYAAAAAAAAKLRQQGVPSPLAQNRQPHRVYRRTATPCVQRLAAPTAVTDQSCGGWNSILAEPVPEVEHPSMARPRSLTVLIILTYAGATFGLIGSLLELLTGGLIGLAGPRALGADDASATALILGTAVFVMALSAARLVIGNYLWYGFPWARHAMMGVLAVGMFPPFLTLCQASGLYEAAAGIGGLLLSLIFLVALNLNSVKEYCGYCYADGSSGSGEERKEAAANLSLI
jgi:tetratricopeptide (TPR) repeat protein